VYFLCGFVSVFGLDPPHFSLAFVGQAHIYDVAGAWDMYYSVRSDHSEIKDGLFVKL
jgi:hypothetical protein